MELIIMFDKKIYQLRDNEFREDFSKLEIYNSEGEIAIHEILFYHIKKVRTRYLLNL